METKKSIQFAALVMVALITSWSNCLSLFAQDANKAIPNKPDIKYKVNKEYDKNGNITRYDSTYSYSWSSNGQIPFDIDSVYYHFKNLGFINFDFDYTFNHLGESIPFRNDSIFGKTFPNFDKQFEDFFKNTPFSMDPFLDNNSKSYIGGDIQKQLFEHQKRMEQLFHDFYLNPDSINKTPNKNFQKNLMPQGKPRPQKQNYFPNKKTNKTISV